MQRFRRDPHEGNGADGQRDKEEEEEEEGEEMGVGAVQRRQRPLRGGPAADEEKGNAAANCVSIRIEPCGSCMLARD